MAEGRVTRLALSDDTRARLTSLLFEASLLLDSVVFGLEAVTHRLPPPTGVEAIACIASQAAEAMGQFDTAFRGFLRQEEAGDAS